MSPRARHDDAPPLAGDGGESGESAGEERVRGRVKRRDRVIGARLREARLEKGCTQDRLAQMLDVSFQSIQRYEHGASVGAGRLVEAADALGVSVMYMMRDLVDADGFPVKEGDARGAKRGALSRDAFEAARLYDGLSEPETRRSVLSILKRLAEG